jgi:trans-2,3-dihydro-3-hydroxyanthranilate isomerase
VGLDFVLVDVFTDRAFGGNQLAVFPHAEWLTALTMQRLAREFNFSETTFVLPPDDPSNTCRVRIFTPSNEMPFAGHPTVGTAAALASLGEVDAASTRGLVFEEGIGPVAVEIDGAAITLHLRSPRFETTAECPRPDAIAAAISLSEADVAESWCAGIGGLRFCFVRVSGPEAVDRAVLERAAWASGVAGGWSPHLYVFAGECRSGAQLYARFFAPAFGIDEDPATGSACAALVASLAERSAGAVERYSIRIDQGVVMGRPSRMHGTARTKGGHLSEVSVGGASTVVGTGVMTLAQS